MCNEIKCAVHENVQIGCTGDVHIAAVWMIGNNGCDYVIKLSPGMYAVMRLSLGAWWPGGKKLSAVFQF